jgi:hypothetical protein
MVEPTRRRRGLHRGLVSFLFGLLSIAVLGGETASLEFDPDRVVRGNRFTIRIRTGIPWNDQIEIVRPELEGPLVWWSYPYARPWLPESSDGETVRMIEVLAAIRVDAPGFHKIDPFRIKAGEREAVTEPKEVIGLEPDEAGFPYPVFTRWRSVPETVWQGQALPVVLEALNLQSLSLADSAVLSSAPQGLLEEAPGLGGIVTRSHGNDMLYDVPMASWIWTPGDPGREVFPAVRVSVAGLTRAAPSFALEVTPLPNEVLQSGAVGRFRLDVERDEGTLRVGDILSVRVRVEGEGNMNVLRLPEPSLEGATLVSRGSSSSYVPGPEGYEGWREDRFDFQIENPGNLPLDVPGWIWLEPVGAGRIRRTEAYRETFSVEATRGDTANSDAALLLGAELFRFGPVSFHWRNQFWLVMALPGFILLATMFLIKRPGTLQPGIRATAAMLILPLFLSASNGNPEQVSRAAQAADAAYRGEWDTALETYRSLQQELGDHPGLLHDLAVVEMVVGDADRSVSHLRRALFLRPGAGRIADTLEILEDRFALNDQIPVPLIWPPALVFALWLVTVNAFFAAFTVLLFKRDARLVLLFVSSIILMMASSLLLLYTDSRWRAPTAVVLADSDPLRKIPGPLSTDWIQLPAGTAVEVVAKEGSDRLVRTGYGLEGWLSEESLDFIAEDPDGL